jgi:Zinc finger, C3HC4 type (RING finger)
MMQKPTNSKNCVFVVTGSTMDIVLRIAVFPLNVEIIYFARKLAPNCHNGMCVNCAVQLGPHKKLISMQDCPVCLENKTMLALKCDHEICNKCWFTITNKGFGDDNEEDYRPLCPLCRNMNSWEYPNR